MSIVTFPLLALVRHRMETDGEGVTTLAVGAGCPLHCKWCINKKLLQEGNPQNVTAEELIERVKVDNLYFLAVSLIKGIPQQHIASFFFSNKFI